MPTSPAPRQRKLPDNQPNAHSGVGERRKNIDEAARFVVEGLDNRVPDKDRLAKKNADRRTSQTGKAVSGNLVDKI